jgi:WD40 repeat protein
MESIERTLTRTYFQETDRNLLELDICNQGINWSRVTQPREHLRKNRVDAHKGHRDQEETNEEKANKQAFHMCKTTDIIYQFNTFIKDINVNVAHFQLRKNMKFLNDKELIYIKKTGIEKYNIITGVRRLLVPFQEEDLENGTKVVCFDCFEYEDKKVIIVCGRIDNCVLVFKLIGHKLLSRERVLIYKMGASGQIVNHVEIFDKGTKLYTGCNDGKVRVHNLDDPKLDEVVAFQAITAVNHLAYSNDLLVAVGDFKEVQLFDIRTTGHVVDLLGHSDFGFSVRFKQNDPNILATGNQDYTCKIWDIRKISKECVCTLYGHFEAIGQLEFSNDLLIYAENMDFLHVYNFNNNAIQTLGYFGHNTGFCLKEDKIYLGIYEYSNHGIMIYDRIRNYKYSLNNICI